MGSIYVKIGKKKKIQSENEIQLKEIGMIDAENIKYELIMNCFHFDNKILKPNAALLITDKNELKADAEMFLAEQKEFHKCGYHYRILFWTNTDSLIGRKSVNQDCEVFGYEPKKAKEKLEYYVKKLETKPTHYIYNLEVPISISPNELREKIQDGNLNLLFLNGEKICYPSIRFSYKYYSHHWKDSNGKTDWEKSKKGNEVGARETFEELIGKVESEYPIVNEWDIHYMGNGTIGDSLFYRQGHIELIFEIGTDLSKVVTILEKAGAEIKNTNNPKTYSAQIVDVSDNIQSIKKKLSQYKFILDVTEYYENNRRK